MAYDLLSRRTTSANWGRRPWSRYSWGRKPWGCRSLGSRPFRSSTFFLAEYTFAPDPLPTTDAEKELVAHLAVLKMKVDGGDKKALKEWRKSMVTVLSARKRASQGDPKAVRLMQVLSESGIFDGVQKMNVAGIDV